MSVSKAKEQIETLLSRSVDTIYPTKEDLERALESGKVLRVYIGIDPTANYVHIGHATNYLLLRRFQKLGHKAIVLVGNFTAMIGDPSDKTAARVRLTPTEVAENLKTFKEQIGKIIDFDDPENPVEFRFNADWLEKLSFADLADLASNFTVQQMLERDTFRKRIKEEKPLYVHEFFYPLMQGYDSVALDADVEIGGTDQTFNMLAGRILQRRYNDKEKFVITTTLLENPKTGEKLMSKSQGTGVSLTSTPDEMYGQVMRLPDEGLVQCFVDCTEVSVQEIDHIRTQLSEGVNPRDIKMRLAREIVTMYHGGELAQKAEEGWTSVFSKGATPEHLEECMLSGDVATTLCAAGVVSSKSEYRRLIEEGAITFNEEKISDPNWLPVVTGVLKVGKRRFVRLIV